MLSVVHFTEGLRMFRRALRVRAGGFHRYAGSAEDICRRVVDSCWNGRYFQVSNGNFPEFWTRDMGWCVDALLTLGYGEKVKATLRYALERFMAAGKVTTTISPGGVPFDFPAYAPDALAYLLESVRKVRLPLRGYRTFLNAEIKKFADMAVDGKTGLIRKDRTFSSMKDHALRQSACYDNVMAAVVQREAGLLKLGNPLEKYNYAKLLKQHFWNGRFFRDDLSGKEYVAADANLFPFVTGIVRDKKMLKAAMGAVARAGLDRPLPLRYTNVKVRMHWVDRFASGYEQQAVWTHMGPLFIALMERVNRKRAAACRKQYGRMIERWGTYPEVLTTAGKPFRSLFYYCDEGMLWAANYLALR